MAACNLKIELDEPKKIRLGGEVVTGTVVVRCDKETSCKGLIVCSRWTTHGRGNVDSGTTEEQTVFQGAWQAGQEYKYPFELNCATWPPTYYGTYLNVSHNIEARAKLSWATDPKAIVEFPVVTSSSPADVQPSRKQSSSMGMLGWVILSAIALIFLIAFWWLLPIVAIVVALVWFFKSFLPKQLTGSIETKLEPRRVRAGEVMRGHLSFTPKRSVTINGVRCTFTGVESCVSGSGSNRKSHSHDLHNEVVELAGGQRLPSSQLQSFDFDILVPTNAAPSMKLSDNQVLWNVEMRIDIPSWPDWTETFPLIVEPGDAAVEASRLQSERGTSAEDEWFEQVLQQLQESSDGETRQMVLDAIREHEFTLSLEIEGEASEPRLDGAPAGPGKWLETYDKQRDLMVELFVPVGAREPAIDAVWRGRVGILGYDSEEEILSVCMLL